MEQVTRIELALFGWEPNVLPLNYTCLAEHASGRTGASPVPPIRRKSLI